MSPDTLFEDVAVDRILESASADEVATIEGAVAWSAAIPALAVLASRCLAGEDIAPQVHALRAVLRELQAQQRGDTLWGDVLDVLESSFVVRDDVVRLREVANAARRDNNRIVWAAAHLILGVNPGVPPANAVVSELHCFAEADRARILLGSSFPRVLVQLLADNWTRRLKGQAFMLSMPRMLEEDLDASQDVSVRKRLRRILRSAVDAAGVRLSADWEVWLKDQGV